eukprot:452499-Alexandrium_andersonii.AAC.1
MRAGQCSAVMCRDTLRTHAGNKAARERLRGARVRCATRCPCALPGQSRCKCVPAARGIERIKGQVHYSGVSVPCASEPAAQPRAGPG